MNSDTQAPSGMSPPWMPSQNDQVANTCVLSMGPPAVMMRNIMAITALFSLIVTFANFDIVRILTAGGPIDRTHVFATWAFWVGIQGNDIPLGASVSLFMVPILTVAAVFILRDINRRAGEMS